MALRSLRIMIVDKLLEQQQIENLICNLDEQRNVVILCVHDFGELHFDLLRSIDLIILEIKTIQLDGFRFIKYVKTQDQDIKILIYSSMDERVFAMPYLKYGASGYLQKSKKGTDLLLAISLVLKGKIYSSDLVKDDAFNAKLSKMDVRPLTKREVSVLMLQAKGCDISYISKRLSLNSLKLEAITVELLKRLKINSVKVLDKVM